MPKREMLINYVPGEECRIALTEDGKLEEFYHERASTESHVSNIYRGVVTNVEPAIQAAFVDFGLEKNGFLHVTDVHPKYFPGAKQDDTEKIGKKTSRRERPPIEKCFKRGSKVMVQVLKEGIGTKGPTVTSYCSIPGRFLVMMPDMERHGVSRKTEDEDARKEMRDILKTLDPPDGFGFIVRTAGLGQTKTDLKRDMAYLLRLWKDIEKREKSLKRKTGELYTESDLVIRTIRDVFTPDIERVVVDDPGAAQRAHEFLAVANPRTKSKVVLYDDPVPLFHRFGIETQIDHIGARTVPLPSGGALVIDPTEALVAIDVNSGKSRRARDAESNAYQTNQEAVDEIARQLRLRDLGGLVVLDLIDMMQAKHRKSIEQRFRNLLKNDRARTRVGGISQFGMLEMTRQRMRPSLKKAIYQECPHCAGQGYHKSPESVVLHVMRQLALVMHRKDVARIELTISPDVAFHILNRKRGELVELEQRHGKAVTVRVGGGQMDYVNIAAFSANNAELVGDPAEGPKAIAPPTDTTFRELTRAEIADLMEELEAEERAEAEAAAVQEKHAEAADADDSLLTDAAPEEDETTGKKKRRRRRRGRKGKDDDTPDTEAKGAGTAADSPESKEATDRPGDGADTEDAPKKKRRRRRRRGKKADAEAQTDTSGAGDAASDEEADESKPDRDAEASGNAQTQTKKRRRSRKKSKAANERDVSDAAPAVESPTEPDGESPLDVAASDDGEPKKKKRRRRRRSKKSDSDTGREDAADAVEARERSASDDDPASSGFRNDTVEVGA